MVRASFTPRRFGVTKNFSRYLLSKFQGTAGFSTAEESARQSIPSDKPSSLSARLSFIFDQIDEIEKKREEKDQTLQRIRAWRESKKQVNNPISVPVESDSTEELKPVVVKNESFLENGDGKKEVELVHPWPEWIELMERLMKQYYFDHKRRDEDGMIESLGFDAVADDTPLKEDKQLDFVRDFKTVQTAMVNFGRDRFDILRSLSRHDLQLLVGYGCPSTDKRVVFSGKLLRKHTHLDEGDVCSSCSLRSSCEKAYLLTNKEDEARTIDVMRILLSYGFHPIDESVTNKDLLKMKAVKTVVRKLLHQVVKLSAVPIDPHLTPPVAKKPPPKVKQPPPPPKKRIGRYDVEMKKGDWLCTKCDFLNFAKNTICLQCEAKRPKRQLLPGEWECPQCNFLNYRRNTVCFHCEHKRPVDTYTENQFPDKQHIPGTRTDKIPDRAAVSNAWNFDFDDDESDGADVAAFEYADTQKLAEYFPPSQPSENPRGPYCGSDKMSREHDGSGPRRPGMGFNDFDEEDDDDVDSYEVVRPNEAPKTSTVKFSDLEAESESEDDLDINEVGGRGKNESSRRGQNQTRRLALSDVERDDIDFDTDEDLPVHPNWKSSHVATPKKQSKRFNSRDLDSDDDDLVFNSESDNEKSFRSRNERNRTRSEPPHRRRGRNETDSDDDDDDNRGRRASSDRFSGSQRHGSDRFSSRHTSNREQPSYKKQSRTSRDTRPPRFDGHGRNGSFDNRRGGRSTASFDSSDVSDERHRRPRNNVR